MRAHRLRVLAFLTTLLALGPSTPGTGGEPPPTVSNLTFHQVDWFEAQNAISLRNSTWGKVSFTYRPTRTTWYLNLTAARPGSPKEFWYLRNLPLFGERMPRLRRQAVYLDLRRLGLSSGEDWGTVQLGLTLDTSIRRKAPKVQRNRTLAVGNHQRHEAFCFGSVQVEPLVPGRPRPILIDNKPKLMIPPRITLPVQEVKTGDCVASSFARSLYWLNQTHGFDKAVTAQEIYEELLKFGVSREEDKNNNKTELDEWIKAKEDYTLLLGLEIETTIWDGANLVPSVQGLKEENGDFREWLERELKKGADVEIGYIQSERRHVTMIAGYIVDENDQAFVFFREDEVPEDNTQGDQEVVMAPLFKGADGRYRLIDETAVISIGFSETVKP